MNALAVGRLTTRIFCVTLGLGSIWWCSMVITPLWSTSSLDHAASRILQTEAYRLPTLTSLIERAGQLPASGVERPEAPRELAIINERLLEQDLTDGRRTMTDLQLDATAKSIEHALTATPSDSFLWLMLYWVRTVKSGFSESNLPLLRMSYLTGPNEGWVALRRNRLTFIADKFLPPDLLERSYAEFVSLLASGFIDEAASIFTGPAWDRRDILLTRIEDLPPNVKQRFARKVYDLGYDVIVPGIARFGDRPWR